MTLNERMQKLSKTLENMKDPAHRVPGDMDEILKQSLGLYHAACKRITELEQVNAELRSNTNQTYEANNG